MSDAISQRHALRLAAAQPTIELRIGELQSALVCFQIASQCKPKRAEIPSNDMPAGLASLFEQRPGCFAISRLRFVPAGTSIAVLDSL